MRRALPVLAAALLCLAPLALLPAPAAAAPEGQITWAVHTTLGPSYFDPAETTLVTPFMVLYGLPDALVKPMPGKSLAPSLTVSWKVSPDGLAYDFVLRKGARFHNGDPVTAEDIAFSFERYRGIQQLVHERAIVAPIYELAFISGVGRRVEESGLGLIGGYAFSAPYEDLKLRRQ
jgi:peptide/nickel transport system substrate-binding protein